VEQELQVLQQVELEEVVEEVQDLYLELVV